MQKLIMDGSELTFEPTYQQLGELLDELYKQVPPGRIMTQIFLDGREVLELQHEALCALSLQEVSTVRVVTTPLATQLQGNVTDLLGFLKEMRPVLRQASRELRYGSIADASNKLADCFAGLETMVKSIDQIASLLPGLDAALSDEELKHFSKKEGQLLADLVRDFQGKDWLSLADRLEFQLDPLMGRWQTVLNRVLGSLKNFKLAEAS